MTSTLEKISPELAELRATVSQYRRERDFLDLLPEIWHSLNVRCFGGSLKQVPMFRLVDYADNTLGMFAERDDGCIIEVHRMFLDGLGVTESERLMAVGAVVAHEQIHQRRSELCCRDKDAHGGAFVKEANRISGIMGIGGRISTAGEYQCRYWPIDIDEQISGIVSRLRESYRAGVPSGV